MGGLFGGGSTTYIEGNRVGEFKLNDSSYGKDVPVILGTTRISCNVIDWADFKEHAHTTEQNSGKGGGGVTTVTTTYTYTVKALLALCEGPISSVKRVWCGTKIYNSPAEAGLTLFNGTPGQIPWDGLKYYGDGVNIGPHYLSYSNLAYCAGEIDLGNGGTLPTFNFEVVSAGVPLADGNDVSPADAINYIIFNEINGAGFGGGTIDAASLENYRNYCRAADLYISIPEDVQGVPAKDLINSILEATNSIGFWSQDKLKIVVLADESITGNGITWSPSLTPLFDLDADHLIPVDKSSGRLVEFTREDSSESYNEITVEFLNRANAYEKETVSFQVLSDISRRGLRPSSTKKIHFFHTKKRAQTAAEHLAMKSLYGRNKYRFRLAWSHCLLEPGDLVTLTDPNLGLDRTLVRINEVDEAADGELEFSAFSASVGIASPARYEVFNAERATLDTNIEPGNAKIPLFFLVAPQISARTIAIATSGINPKTWGGAIVWVSFDNVSYSRIGEVKGPARYGVLLEAIDPDDTEITVRLEDGGAQLLSVTEQAAAANSTPCWLNGEWINYRDAELIAERTYRLSEVTRGLYRTKAVSHSAGAGFARHDSAITQYPYREEDIGKTLYIKLQSFNIFLTNIQDISTVPAYTYSIARGLYDALPSKVTGFQAIQDGNVIDLFWDANSDVNFSHYEIRSGYTWSQGAVIQKKYTETSISFPVSAERTYGFSIKAVSVNGDYSADAATVQIAVSDLPPRNVTVTWYDMYLEWEDVPGQWDSYPTAIWYYPLPIGSFDNTRFITNPITFGTIEKSYLDYPSTRWIDLGNDFVLTLAENVSTGTWESEIKDLGKLITANLGYDFSYLSANGASARLEVRHSQDSVKWTEWQLFTRRTATFRYIQYRVCLTASASEDPPYVTILCVEIDMPDVVKEGRVTIPVGGAEISYDFYFARAPTVLLTADGADRQAKIIGTPGYESVHVRVIDTAETDVGGVVNWSAYGY